MTCLVCISCRSARDCPCEDLSGGQFTFCSKTRLSPAPSFTRANGGWSWPAVDWESIAVAMAILTYLFPLAGGRQFPHVLRHLIPVRLGSLLDAVILNFDYVRAADATVLSITAAADVAIVVPNVFEILAVSQVVVDL